MVVYTSLYVHHGEYGGVYLPICLPGMPTMVYHPVYTLLYIPGYTTLCLYLLSAVGTGARLQEERALGSEGRNPLGRGAFPS